METSLGSEELQSWKIENKNPKRKRGHGAPCPYRSLAYASGFCFPHLSLALSRIEKNLIIVKMPEFVPPSVEYHCPGEEYPISRAVHLGRLARFYPACRQCMHRDDTGTLSDRQVSQLIETRSRAENPSWFSAEGATGVCPNELGIDAVQAITVAFGLREMRRIVARSVSEGPLASLAYASGYDVSVNPRSESAEPPLVVLGSDGRAMTAELVATAAESLRCAGCNLIDVGAVTSACMAWAIDHWQAAGGILIGNTDDRPQTVGLKFWSDGARPLSAGHGLDEIEAMCGVPAERPTRTFGSRQRFQAADLYLATLAEHYHALRPLRFVIGTMSLAVGNYVQKLIAGGACRASIAPLRWNDLIEQVRVQKAHFGLHVSNDGEIVRLADECGNEIPAERLLLLLGQVTTDALRTLTTLLGLLSRSDRPLSVVFQED